jgi:hypothetical protein
MYLDHTVLITTALNRVAAYHERLGFTLSPASRHHLAARPGEPLVPTCTANRCAYFGQSFLELLGIVDEAAPDPWGVHRLAESYSGGLLLTIGCADADATGRRLKDNDLSTGEVRGLKREVDTPEGPREIRADSVLVHPHVTPGTAVQASHHFTPEYVHQPRYLQHPNGAKALVAVHLVVPDRDLPAHTSTYERILGVPARGNAFQLPAGRLELLPESAVDRHFPGFRPRTVPLLAAQTIGVHDLQAARRLIEANDIPTWTTPTGFYAADDTAIGFTEV